MLLSGLSTTFASILSLWLNPALKLRTLASPNFRGTRSHSIEELQHNNHNKHHIIPQPEKHRHHSHTQAHPRETSTTAAQQLRRRSCTRLLAARRRGILGPACTLLGDWFEARE